MKNRSQVYDINRTRPRHRPRNPCKDLQVFDFFFFFFLPGFSFTNINDSQNSRERRRLSL